MKLFATALLVSLASSMSFAVTPVSPKVFDCGTLSEAQGAKLENETSANGLKVLAKTCDEQAATFEKTAQEAGPTLTALEVTDLFEKAANAHMHVASFTNQSFMKN